MLKRKVNLLILSSFLTLLICGIATAQQTSTNEQDENEAATQNQYETPPEAITVYVNISGLSSRRGHASKLTELHAQQALNGWTLLSVQLHTENGDLEGFYVTYTRKKID